MIHGSKGDSKYNSGLVKFYEFVLNNMKDLGRIPCPCDRCLNFKYMSFPDVKIHLEKYKFNQNYRRWIFHGESL